MIYWLHIKYLTSSVIKIKVGLWNHHLSYFKEKLKKNFGLGAEADNFLNVWVCAIKLCCQGHGMVLWCFRMFFKEIANWWWLCWNKKRRQRHTLGLLATHLIRPLAYTILYVYYIATPPCPRFLTDASAHMRGCEQIYTASKNTQDTRGHVTIIIIIMWTNIQGQAKTHKTHAGMWPSSSS